MKTFAIGQYDTQGVYQAYVKPVELIQFGDTLRTDFGHCIAILDEYDDWVSPTMRELGLKSIIKIEER